MKFIYKEVLTTGILEIFVLSRPFPLTKVVKLTDNPESKSSSIMDKIQQKQFDMCLFRKRPHSIQDSFVRAYSPQL